MDLHILQKMTGPELDVLFSETAAGDVPDGKMDGIVLRAVVPIITPEVALLIKKYIWQGKTFDAERRILFNRFPTTEAVSATLSIGPSLYDQADCIVVDYSHSVVSHVRDELRQVAPGLYLGKAYQDQRPLIHFALTGAV